MRLGIALALLVLVGCRSSAEDVPHVDFYRGGSRLKARVIVGDGGAKYFLGFRDVFRGFDCSPRRTADGRLRCVPDSTVLEFADASCTQPVIVSDCGKVRKFAVDEDVAACGAVTVYAAGASSETREAYDSYLGRCSKASDSMPSAPATRVDPETFAAFTESEVQLGDVTVRVASSEDGAAMVLGSKVTGTDQPCFPQAIGDPYGDHPPFACVPSNLWVNGWDFADAGCTELAAYGQIDVACEPVPKIATTYAHGACEQHVEYYEVEGELTSAFSTMTGTCKPSTPLEPGPGIRRRTYKLGAKIESPSFPRVDRVEVGTGPLKTHRFAIGDNAFAQTYEFLINGEHCLPKRFADGATRCVPTVYVQATETLYPTFSDAACTQSVFAETHDACGIRSPRYAVFENSVDCEFIATKAHKLGSKVLGARHVARGTCTVDDPTAWDLYEDLGEVPVEVAFPKLTEVLE